MSLTNLRHGDTRTNKIKTGDGSNHLQPEIYCVEHGWLLMFVVGGKDGFKQKHWFCNQEPKNGTVFETKVLAKAA